MSDNGTFEYRGHEFTPYRKLYGGAATFRYISKHISTEGVFLDESNGWSHEAFYKAAGEKRTDIFECMGSLWIPGEKCLWAWVD